MPLLDGRYFAFCNLIICQRELVARCDIMQLHRSRLHLKRKNSVGNVDNQRSNSERSLLKKASRREPNSAGLLCRCQALLLCLAFGVLVFGLRDELKQ